MKMVGAGLLTLLHHRPTFSLHVAISQDKITVVTFEMAILGRHLLLLCLSDDHVDNALGGLGIVVPVFVDLWFDVKSLKLLL